MHIPQEIDVLQAAHRINDFIHKTPLFQNEVLNSQVGGEVWLKCENMQVIHAFKARGAFNALLKLKADNEVMVATHSSGNHGQALAFAAFKLGRKACIVMPNDAPQVKIAGVRQWGAEIVFCKPGLANREAALQEVLNTKNAVFIPPYNHWDIIEGQGTCAVEILQALPDLDYLIAPVGGGGLISGTALAARQINPKTQVLGAEPSAADDAYQSFQTGELIPLKSTTTIADGLRTSLGDITFSVIKEQVADIGTVSEEEIIEAWRFAFEECKLLIEPSCAVPIAYVLKNKELLKNKKSALIITGGNVDVDFFLKTLYPIHSDARH